MCRTSFRRELSRLSRLQHSHLVRLIAVCCHAAGDRPYGIIVEYPIYGDLKCYLRQRVIVPTAAVDVIVPTTHQLPYNSSLTSVTSTV